MSLLKDGSKVKNPQNIEKENINLEKKLKHLEFIQAVINRMAGNSFMIKGWSVTVLSLVSAFVLKDGDPRLVPVGYFLVLMFWFLDAYYLKIEKNYRELYKAVSKKTENAIDFNLSADAYTKKAGTYGGVLFSTTLLLFYGALLVFVIVVHHLSGGCHGTTCIF